MNMINNIVLSVFSCIIILMCFAPFMISSSTSSLSTDYYDESCPSIQSMVQWGVWNATQAEPRVAASILRMHFHDCFGCDASVLLKDTKTFTGEQNAGPNKNSARGFEVIDNIKADAEKYCRSTVSCADILALAAKEAVAQSGGPSWNVPLGRMDGLTASQSLANKDIPTPSDSVDTILAKFKVKGLDKTDMITLSGGHTLGFARCTSFKSRLYNFNTTFKSDPTINPTFLKTLQKQCPNNAKSDQNLVPLDLVSPNKLDNAYYQDLINQTGILQSDQALMSDSRTVGTVRRYSSNPNRFSEDFAFAMVKLGSVGVITRGQERRGEIRKKCGFVN